MRTVLQGFVERWIGSEERVQRAERVRPQAPGPSPLQADLDSRKLRGPQELALVARRPPWKEVFGSFHPSDYYVFVLRMPDGLFREEEVPELANWIRGLNAYLKRPIVEFTWNQKQCGHYYSSSHQVGLRPEWHVEPSRRAESARATLSHEMMHGLFHSDGLDRDAAWRSIYRLSLADRSYELFDDSNYSPSRPDYYGHPYDSESEAFASAGAAYYQAADAMAQFILHPETPEDMGLVGRAAWCYLRDRVFGGKVFTERGEDPFAGESLDSLLAQVAAGEPRALWRAYWGEDPDVFDPARAGLIDYLLRRNPT